EEVDDSLEEEVVCGPFVESVQEGSYSSKGSGTCNLCGDPVVVGAWTWRRCILFFVGEFENHVFGSCLLMLK
ncbi:hypothetical protein A2U01_0090739, partial [Trifolium medium]|nr:hypothetical protein [Trifolium medium]